MKAGKISYILLIVFTIVLAGCHRERRPEGMLEESVLVDFLVDAHLLEAYYSVQVGFRIDSVAADVAASYEELYAKYSTSKEQVDKTRDYYQSHFDEYKAVYEQVEEKLAHYADNLPPALPDDDVPQQDSMRVIQPVAFPFGKTKSQDVGH